RLGVEGCERYEGTGVYYAATPNEARLCRGTQVVLVGGGNSAGEGAGFLAGQPRKGPLVLPGADMDKSRSRSPDRLVEAKRQHRPPPHHADSAHAWGRPSDGGQDCPQRDGRSAHRRDAGRV